MGARASCVVRAGAILLKVVGDCQKSWSSDLKATRRAFRADFQRGRWVAKTVSLVRMSTALSRAKPK